MKRFLLDTNHLSEAILPVSKLREKLHSASRRGDRLGTCVPALCELEIWLHESSHAEQRHRQLKQLLLRVSIWPLEQEMAGTYAEVFLFSKAKGKALSQVDLMLAALARLQKLTILTTDKDFAVFPDIPVENWLK